MLLFLLGIEKLKNAYVKFSQNSYINKLNISIQLKQSKFDISSALFLLLLDGKTIHQIAVCHCNLS